MRALSTAYNDLGKRYYWLDTLDMQESGLLRYTTPTLRCEKSLYEYLSPMKDIPNEYEIEIVAWDYRTCNTAPKLRLI